MQSRTSVKIRPLHGRIAFEPQSRGKIAIRIPKAVRPSTILLFFVGPTLLGGLSIPADQFVFLWHEPYFISGSFKAACCFVWVLAVVAAWAIEGPDRASFVVTLTEGQMRRLEVLTRLLAAATFAAYFVWLGIGVLRGFTPRLALEVLRGSAGAMYAAKFEIFAPVGGVTTWMAIGGVAGALLAVRWRISGSRPTFSLGALLALSGLRAIMASERIAFLEVLIPVLLVLAMTSEGFDRRFATWRRTVVFYASGWAALYGAFGITEYIRSWSNHYAMSQGGSYWTFAFDRLMGYYATALNNAALASTSVSRSTRALLLAGGQYSLGSLELLPAQAIAHRNYGGLLQAYSNPEFNNISGVGLSLGALGLIGASVLWLCIVALLAAGSLAATRGSIAGLVAYAASSLGLLEAVRIFYFGESRYIIVLVGLAVVRTTLGRRLGSIESATHLTRRDRPPCIRST